jgi:hypothetical protein
VGDLAVAAARLARDRVGPGRRALAAAGRAHDRGVHLELTAHAERRLGQLDVEPDQRVLPAAYARSWPAGLGAGLAAEEGVHDVGEREPGSLAAEAGPAEGVPATVVGRALLRVGEHLVGARDLLEALLGLRVGVDVRVQLARESSVGLLDGVGVRVAADTQEVVQVLAHSGPSGRYEAGC